MDALPEGIALLLPEGVRRLDPERILLYGSRARGDHRPTSDWDLAFSGVADEQAWTDFSFDNAYDPITLLPVDVVNLERADPDFHREITRDAVTLYERDAPL